MEERLVELFKKEEFDELEKELKKLYPQIDCIDWHTAVDVEQNIDLNIVFVKMPYMLPFSGSAYAHFANLVGDEYGESLETIMSQCRVIEKEDVFDKYSSIEADNYANDLENRGYDLSVFNNVYGVDYTNILWNTIEEIKEKENL